MADFIESTETALLRADVKAAAETTAITTAITYVAVSAKSVNYATGVVTPTSTSTAVNAFVQPLSVREVEASANRYMVGDLKCWIAIDRISEPNERDYVTISSTDYRIVSWDEDSLKARWRLILRKV
jgi:hypothetical protein